MQIGWLKRQLFLTHSHRGYKSKIEVLVDSVPAEVSGRWKRKGKAQGQDRHRDRYRQTHTQRVMVSEGKDSLTGSGSFHMTPSNLNCLLKFSSPNTITFGVST